MTSIEDLMKESSGKQKKRSDPERLNAAEEKETREVVPEGKGRDGGHRAAPEVKET